MSWKLVTASIYLAAALPAGPRLPIPEFSISLDASPEDRFTEVLQYFKSDLQRFVAHLHGTNPVVKLLLAELVKHRGPENDELQGEIRNVAKVTGLPEADVHALQMFYEFNTIMVPIENFTGVRSNMSVKEIAGVLASPVATNLRMSVGCTGIVAMDDADGTVYHARNLDFSFSAYMQAMAFTGIFTRKGLEVFGRKPLLGTLPF
jgi:hypothetical protein